jgi:hypothetical protein
MEDALPESAVPPATSLKELQPSERVAFVEMVWEHSYVTRSGLDEALRTVAERLGVHAPPMHTLKNWRMRYNVTIPTRRQLPKKQGIKVLPPLQGVGPAVPVKAADETLLAVIAAADAEVLAKLEACIAERRAVLEQQRQREIAILDDEIRKLQEKRAALGG